jgi:hypothetical protein
MQTFNDHNSRCQEGDDRMRAAEMIIPEIQKTPITREVVRSRGVSWG